MNYWTIVLMICILVASISGLLYTVINNLIKGVKDEIEREFKKLGNARFLGKADKIVSRETVALKKAELFDQAKDSIKILGVTGLFSLGPWTIESLIRKSTKENIKIQILLLDPNSPILEYFANHEGELTINPSVVGRISQDDSETRKTLMKNDILGTLRSFRDAAENRSVDIRDIADIRIYDSYPFWRGIIVDGKRTGYAIVHFLRDGTEAPFIENDNVKIVKHFEKYYFDKIWEEAKPVHDVV